MMIKIKNYKNLKNLLLSLNPHHIFEEEKIFYCVESLIIYLWENFLKN